MKDINKIEEELKELLNHIIKKANTLGAMSQHLGNRNPNDNDYPNRCIELSQLEEKFIDKILELLFPIERK